jgi:hypothetical protein
VSRSRNALRTTRPVEQGLAVSDESAPGGVRRRSPPPTNRRLDQGQPAPGPDAGDRLPGWRLGPGAAIFLAGRKVDEQPAFAEFEVRYRREYGVFYPDGGWGDGHGAPASTQETAWALLGLSSAGQAGNPAATAAAKWLVSTQRADDPHPTRRYRRRR